MQSTHREGLFELAYLKLVRSVPPLCLLCVRRGSFPPSAPPPLRASLPPGFLRILLDLPLLRQIVSDGLFDLPQLVLVHGSHRLRPQSTPAHA